MVDKHDSTTGRSRRSFLAVAGTGVTVATVGTGVVSSLSSQDTEWQKLYEQLKPVYGPKEAKRVTDIAIKYRRLGRKKGRSEEWVWRQTVSHIIGNKKTPEASEDFRQYSQWKRQMAKRTSKTGATPVDATVPEMSSDIGTQDNTCGGCGGGGDGTTRVWLDYGKTNTDGTAAAVEIKADYDTSEEYMRVQGSTGGLGSATSEVYLWGKYTPPTTGYYRLEASYYREAEIVDGTIDVNFAVRESGWNYAEAEPDYQTTISGNTSSAAQFQLSGGAQYDVGMYVRGFCDSNSDEGAKYDMYDENVSPYWELDVSDFYVDPV